MAEEAECDLVKYDDIYSVGQQQCRVTSILLREEVLEERSSLPVGAAPDRVCIVNYGNK